MSNRRTLVTVLMLLIAVVAAVNWPYRYKSVSSSLGAQVTSAVDFEQHAPSTPVMGGWPYRYLIRYEGDAGMEAVVHFSPRALVYNVGLAALVSAAALFYVSRRGRRRGAGRSISSALDSNSFGFAPLSS